MNGFHQLLIPGKIVYGRGSFTQTGEVASQFGKRALIVSDPVRLCHGGYGYSHVHLAIPLYWWWG